MASKTDQMTDAQYADAVAPTLRRLKISAADVDLALMKRSEGAYEEYLGRKDPTSLVNVERIDLLFQDFVQLAHDDGDRAVTTSMLLGDRNGGALGVLMYRALCEVLGLLEDVPDDEDDAP